MLCFLNMRFRSVWGSVLNPFWIHSAIRFGMRLGSNPASPRPAGPANGSKTDPPNGPPAVLRRIREPTFPSTGMPFSIRFGSVWRSVSDPFGDPFANPAGAGAKTDPQTDPQRIKNASFSRETCARGSAGGQDTLDRKTHFKRTPKHIPYGHENASKTDSPMHVKRIIRLLHNNPVLAEPDFHKFELYNTSNISNSIEYRIITIINK